MREPAITIMIMIAATMITATRAVGADAANPFSIIFGFDPARCQNPKRLEKLSLDCGKMQWQVLYSSGSALSDGSLRELPLHHILPAAVSGTPIMIDLISMLGQLLMALKSRLPKA